MPKSVKVIEVGMRDGLQIEPVFVPTATKIELINDMVQAGVRHIEATSFVSPRAVPQLADAAQLLAGVNRKGNTRFSALAPNRKGVDRAIEAQADEIVFFLSASESHNNKNLNREIQRSLEDIAESAAVASKAGVSCKGAVAVAFGCPFEGDVSLATLKKIIKQYVTLGVESVTLGDTTGMATPTLVRRTVDELQSAFPGLQLSLHFHNTRGLGLVNVMAGLQMGISSFESSIGGLGGCPFAPGATGNICTEDLVNLLNEMDIHTGIELSQLIEISTRMQSLVGHALPGQVMKAGPRNRLHRLDDVTSAIG